MTFSCAGAVCTELLPKVYERICSSWTTIWGAFCRGRVPNAAVDAATAGWVTVNKKENTNAFNT